MRFEVQCRCKDMASWGSSAANTDIRFCKDLDDVRHWARVKRDMHPGYAYRIIDVDDNDAEYSLDDSEDSPVLQSSNAAVPVDDPDSLTTSTKKEERLATITIYAQDRSHRQLGAPYLAGVEALEEYIGCAVTIRKVSDQQIVLEPWQI